MRIPASKGLKATTAWFLALAGFATSAGPRTSFADEARSKPGASKTQRVVSLAPNLTELLFALGAGADVVGVTEQCDHPPEARRKPKMGSYSSPNLESLIAARPSVVFATEGNNRDSVERLKARGVEVVEVNPGKASELPAAVRAVGESVQRKEAADILATRIEQGLGRLRQGRPARKRFLLVLQVDPIISVTPGTWLGDVFREAGFENVLGESKIRYPVVNDEFLMTTHRPEVYFVAHEVNLARLRARVAGFPKPRGGDGSVGPDFIVLPKDVFVRPGPRITEAFDFLAKLKSGNKGNPAAATGTPIQKPSPAPPPKVRAP